MPALPNLFAPITIRNLTIRNRILSTGHDTTLPTAFVPNDALVAYHRARAAGGAGLIVMQVAGVHETARYTAHLLMATTDDCIPGYARVADAVHAHGCALFGQLFHPGREIMESQDGTLPVAYAPSAVPNERFHVTPRPMSAALIAQVIAGYAMAAQRLERAGLDGVEVVASHGYLPAQFLNPRVNLRTDAYGGDDQARRRFLADVLAAIRAATGPDFIVGLRISGDEKDADGLSAEDVMATLVAFDGQFDYYNITAGTSAGIGSAVNIAPPMAVAHGHLAPLSASIRARVGTPVFVAGRINQPQDAERILASGAADMVGMTRALICDPEMPAKARDNRLDDIRACIACNQACIGHFHMGYPISCIQHPETGRELTYGAITPAPRPRRIVIAGGGPAGMKAAAVAAARGHQVILCEAGRQLGGQALLAQMLPSRAEFGGIVTNLAREMALAGVDVRLNQPVTRALIDQIAPAAVVIATGATPRSAPVEGAETGHVVNPWQVLRNEVNVGASVLIADWSLDWIGLGLAERLARAGCRVRLAVDGYMAGQRVHQYVRDLWIGTLHDLGVEVIPYARLYGIDGQTVFCQHASNGAPMLFEDVDTLITNLGHQSVCALEDELAGTGLDLHVIGDALTPRTAEEAVFEGLKVAVAL
ncbi:FAD-dependent oxidoreductase [Novosphingobium sp. FSW06-99]|uniref:oxidoreductase n=1 Tax=Novosphingobium sp. FSW06-99 TaxID=1739113 RepID=UPI00076BE766|nr:FAD-dependent oxidoreductase [Novosphingobium sp. FSW06-99]KUR76099.1 oxidoreductase [Novosphingobium sp. FSW06-99]